MKGDGGVHSTVGDLLKWDRALYTDTLISYSSIKEMFQPAELKDKTKAPYGFGWHLDRQSKFWKNCIPFWWLGWIFNFHFKGY